MNTVTICRHAVRSLDDGLSPLQYDLLNCPSKIRIADAPTGAGKSYVFQRAVLVGQRVLFIVPTRRLAQNLLHSLRDFLKSQGWSEGKRTAKTALWSADETRRLREEGVIGEKQITGYRIRQLYGLDDAREGGEMIIAIPETVSAILLRRSLDLGLSDTGPLDFLTQFDHIVFDEFHTIDPRGYGMAAVLAKLACVFPMTRAKLSFLSATPLEIQPVLRRLGIPESAIKQLKENVVSCKIAEGKDRIVHGDVSLRFVGVPDMYSLLKAHANLIQNQTAKSQRGLVVVIYNSVTELQLQVDCLAAFFDELGVSRTQRLLVNSIDDSGRGQIAEREFTTGPQHNPNDFKILVATASVEMGVTFDTDLLFMEPGFEPLNFLQRYGRAARGDFSGVVLLRWDESLRKRLTWLPKLLRWAEQRDGQTCVIDELSKTLKGSVVRRFAVEEDEELADYGALPQRTVWLAGLYWFMLQQQKGYNRYLRERLFEHSPKQASKIAGLLKQVEALQQDTMFDRYARLWLAEYKKQAYNLRTIGRRIKLREPNGGSYSIPEHVLYRIGQKILEECISSINDQGEEEIQLNAPLDAYLAEADGYQPRRAKRLLFPHRAPETVPNKDSRSDDDLVKSWCEMLANKSGVGAMAWRKYPDALAAAAELVKLTRLVLLDDTGEGWETAHGVI
ncbi:MAG: DEAD/DEAH box helicase [Gammaproteobacteria bacterium]